MMFLFSADQTINLGSALLGAGILEVIYWREIYQKLEAAKYRKLINSRSYWVLTVLFVLGSALGSIIWNHGETSRPKDYFIVAAAFGPIVKSALKSFSPKRTLGDNDLDTYLLR
jgi:hypothetical protein